MKKVYIDLDDGGRVKEVSKKEADNKKHLLGSDSTKKKKQSAGKRCK